MLTFQDFKAPVWARDSAGEASSDAAAVTE
jgi:hypothetical protein